MAFSDAILACVLCGSHAATSFDDRASRVSEWLQTETRRGDVTPLSFRWTLQTPNKGESAASGSATMCFHMSGESWHLSQITHSASGNTSVVEHSVTPDVAWKLAGGWLYVAQPHPPFPEGHHFDRKALEAQRVVSLMTCGGLDMFAAGDFDLKRVFVEENGTWKAIAKRQTLSADINGRWDTSLNRGFVEDMMIQEEGTTARSWRFSDWRWNDDLQSWIAHIVECRDIEHTIMYELRFGNASRSLEQPSEIQFAVPAFNTLDSTRGVRIDGMTDCRQHPVVHKLASGGTVHETTDSQLRASAAATKWRWRIAGWCACTSAIFIVLAFRVATSRASTVRKEIA